MHRPLFLSHQCSIDPSASSKYSIRLVSADWYFISSVIFKYAMWTWLFLDSRQHWQKESHYKWKLKWEWQRSYSTSMQQNIDLKASETLQKKPKFRSWSKSWICTFFFCFFHIDNRKKNNHCWAFCCSASLCRSSMNVIRCSSSRTVLVNVSTCDTKSRMMFSSCFSLTCRNNQYTHYIIK